MFFDKPLKFLSCPVVQVPGGRDIWREGTGVCPGGPSMGELWFFAVCKNQSFDSSGVEIASVPVELCGTALNLNPNNLKRLLCFRGPGSASLETEADVCIFRCKFLHPAAGGSSKCSVT